jgi:hypothetical protein
LVTRYFDVNPAVVGLAYGISGLTARQRQLEEEAKERKRARKARQKKTLITGVGAAAGAVGGLLLAPALGLAGTAGATGAAAEVGTGAATAAGALAGPVQAAATAGALGFGGALSGAGSLAAGLTGAAFGAQAAGAFSEGDVAGGFGAIATPIVGALAHQQGRRDRVADRAANLADALTLDAARTEGNIRQATAVADYEKYGMSAADAKKYAESEYAAMPEWMPADPQGPSAFDLDTPGGMSYADPRDNPYIEGQSSVEGMDKRWANATLTRKGKLVQDRLNTVGNPAWVNSNTQERVRAQEQSLARAEAALKTTLMPHQPTMQERVQQQTWTDPNTGVMWHTGDMKPTLPSKASEQGPYWMKSAKSSDEMQEMKTEDFEAKTHIDKQGRTWKYDPRNEDWEYVKDDKENKGADYRKEAAKRIKEARGPEERVKAVDVIEEYGKEKETAFALEISDYNPKTVTQEEYIAIGDKIEAQYGPSPHDVPLGLSRAYYDLGARFRIGKAIPPGDFGD